MPGRGQESEVSFNCILMNRLVSGGSDRVDECDIMIAEKFSLVAGTIFRLGPHAAVPLAAGKFIDVFLLFAPG